MKNNTMCKRFFTLILLVMFGLVSTVHIEANEKKTPITDHVTMVGDAIKGTLWSGVNYERMHIESERAGSYYSTDAGLVYSWDSISVIAENNPAIKVASWGLSPTREGYKQGTTSAIAEDYEKTHPGYTVLAAINGDFFANTQFTTSKGTTAGPTFEPINTWVADGGITYKRPTIAHQHHNVVGIRLDRTYTYHIGSTYASDGTPIDDAYTYDKNGENLPQFTDTLIASINGVEVPAYVTSGALKEEGVNIVLPGSYNIDTTGYSVVRFNIDRMSRATDGFQGKYFVGHNYPGHSYNMEYTGLYLTGRSYDAAPQTGVPITDVSENNFYIITKEDSIKNEIAQRVRITCQYNLTGDVWGDVNSTIGTVLPFLIDGKRTQSVSNTNNYLNDQKPKSVIAFTKDNDAIFYFMGPGPLSGSRDKGPSSIEMCEMLEKLGAYNAFCLDGGGSATIVIKNETGGFTELNTPTDGGGTRSIGNALLMIIENSNLTLKQAKTTSATFHQSAPMAESTLVSATLHMNNKSYELVDGEVEVTGLTKNKSYDYYFEYTYENNGVTYSTRTNTETFTTPSSDEIEHIHDYVDGVCTGCGAIDPNFGGDLTELELAVISATFEVQEYIEEKGQALSYEDYESLLEKLGVDIEKVETVEEVEALVVQFKADFDKLVEVKTHVHTKCDECGKCTAANCPVEEEKCPGHKKPASGCQMGALIISPIILAACLLFIKRRR
ncbi:MAG: phosphodiester glycosidase family protein [Bacilli bacterium]|nr:phosphodiester glycosidase family protein [Bacilli bacterium]